MSNTIWGGKDIQGWIEQCGSQSIDDRKIALFRIGQMLYNGYIPDESDVMKAIGAITFATKDQSKTVETRAYGALSSFARYYAFELSKSKVPERRLIAQISFRRMIRDSKALPLDLIQCVPDVVDAMLEHPHTSKDSYSELTDRLQLEVPNTIGECKQELTNVIGSIANKIPK